MSINSNPLHLDLIQACINSFCLDLLVRINRNSELCKMFINNHRRRLRLEYIPFPSALWSVFETDVFLKERNIHFRILSTFFWFNEWASSILGSLYLWWRFIGWLCLCHQGWSLAGYLVTLTPTIRLFRSMAQY